MIDNKRVFDLQRFAEGTSASVDGEGASQQQGVKAAGNARRSKRVNSLAHVNYGLQPQEQKADESRIPAEEKKEPKKGATQEEFDAFIKENRALYDARVQSLMQDRLKKVKPKADSFDEASPMLDLLHEKYGTKDIKSLVAAVQADEALFEREAMEHGLDSKTYMSQIHDKRELEALRGAEKERKREAAARAEVEEWTRQAESLKDTYPNFDFSVELKNENFTKLLKNGLTVRDAFAATHLDDLLSHATMYAAQDAEARVTERIATRNSRPTESGLESESAGIETKTDVKKLTKADRREIARQARGGKRISFG